MVTKKQGISFLRGGQFESAEGGQFAPARADFYIGTGVVNLDRRRLVNSSGFSNHVPGFHQVLLDNHNGIRI